MKQIKQSFVEIIEGQPRKEHYLRVSLVVLSVSLVVVVALHFFKIK